jgi:tRNA pseudouridine13 synthase
VARALARALGASDRDVGYAGLKDRAAVTSQWFSLPVARDPDPASLIGEGWRVLRASRHGNKLRLGHARGNRFTLVVRGGDPEKARACAAALTERGFPNFFGAQRFGVEGRNSAVGKALLLGQTTDAEVRRAGRDRFMRRLCLSAWQAELFNRWLVERMADGLFDRALAGDVMKKLDSGGLFVCEDPATDGPRAARFEIAPAGPIFGHKMREAAGEARAREERLLRAEGVTEADLRRGGGEAEGTRRASRLKVEVALESIEVGYRARFELPSGSYATVLLGELTKGAGTALPEGE